MSGCGLCGPGSCSERPAASLISTAGMRITAAPGNVTSPVGCVYRPSGASRTSRWAASSVPHRSCGSDQPVCPTTRGPSKLTVIPITIRPDVASSGNSLLAAHDTHAPGTANGTGTIPPCAVLPLSPAPLAIVRSGSLAAREDIAVHLWQVVGVSRVSAADTGLKAYTYLSF